MDKSLQKLKQDAEILHHAGETKTDESITRELWLKGEYTKFNQEHN